MAKVYVHCITHQKVNLTKPESDPVTFRAEGSKVDTQMSAEDFFNFHVELDKLAWLKEGKDAVEPVTSQQSLPWPPNHLRKSG